MEPELTPPTEPTPPTPPTPEPTEPTRNLGGRPRKPNAPTTASDCRHLLAVEITKENPSATRQRLLKDLLDSLEKQEAQTLDKELAQSQADNANLQTEIGSLRGVLAASQARCESLAVPSECDSCDSLQRDLTRAKDDLSRATDALKEARVSQAVACEARGAAEQNEKQARGHLDSQYMKLIDPCAAALSASSSGSGSSIEARERRVRFEGLFAELKRLHALALASLACVANTQAPRATQAQATQPPRVTQAKVLADRIEADRVDNLNQPRSAEPMAFEHLRERFVPRAPEPEPRKQISGGNVDYGKLWG